MREAFSRGRSLAKRTHAFAPAHMHADTHMTSLFPHLLPFLLLSPPIDILIEQVCMLGHLWVMQAVANGPALKIQKAEEVGRKAWVPGSSVQGNDKVKSFVNLANMLSGC